MESFEIKGVWWLPDTPDEKVMGVLKFDPVQGAILETSDLSFTNKSIVIGLDEYRREITLFDIQAFHVDSRNYTSVKYRIQVILKGCHFKKAEDIFFDSISIEYANLAVWLGISGFTQESSEKPFNLTIKYSFPDNINLRIHNFHIKFFHLLNTTLNFVNGNYVHLKQRALVELTPDQPKHYVDFQKDIIYPLESFLSFITSDIALPLQIIGKTKAIEYTVNIYYKQEIDIGSRKEIYDHHMIFRYINIHEYFQDIFENWFNKTEKLHPVLNLYLGIWDIPSKYPHLQFLSLTQALEAYHRFMHDGFYMPEDEYEKVRDVLIEAIPHDPNIEGSHRDSLKSRIKFGNEYSLRKRLDSLFKILEPYNEILERVDIYIDRPSKDRLSAKKFIKELVDTRNYLTHYGEMTEDVITDPHDLMKFVKKMRLLIILCLLHELELPNEVIVKLIWDHISFNTEMFY